MRHCFVVWQNTDTTEGKGFLRPIGHFESRHDAQIFGRGKDVQGSNCRVTQEPLIEQRSAHERHYGPVYVTPASVEGKKQDAFDSLRKEIVWKAQQLGLTEEEIRLIEGVQQ